MAGKAQQRALMLSLKGTAQVQSTATVYASHAPFAHRRRLKANNRISDPKYNVNPASKGWTYQGSNTQSRVEYWAKDGCKMDYYPTTGTVKTSMEHPSQGKTQMFRRGLDDAGFQQVLNNPRHHSGQGYQKRPAKQ